MRISDWSSDVCSSDLEEVAQELRVGGGGRIRRIRDEPVALEPVDIDETVELPLVRERLVDAAIDREPAAFDDIEGALALVGIFLELGDGQGARGLAIFVECLEPGRGLAAARRLAPTPNGPAVPLGAGGLIG